MITLEQQIEEAMGQPPRSVRPLSGGCVGEVYAARLADGRQVVVKKDERPSPRLDREGYMLRYLAEKSKLPVPEVFYSSARLLVMEFIQGESRFSEETQHHAAELLAGLHEVSALQFGLEKDTLIGSLQQPNPWMDSWIDFFREQRLLYMAREAEKSGRLPAEVRRGVEVVAGHLERWLVEPERPSLIHGDVWTTNVLASGGRVTGFIDPAIYYADPEIELAFTTLFGTFGEPFFQRYQELRPLAPGFFEERRDLYNLYPLLVHVRLFGGSYVGGVQRLVRRFGG